MAIAAHTAPSTKNRPDVSDGWAHSGVTALVMRGLEARRPDLLPAGVKVPECTHSARAPAGLKRDLLVRAYEGGGASLILDMSQDLKRVGFDPILHVLLASKTPQVLAEKWQRFERYTHSTNRLSLTPDGEKSLITGRSTAVGGETHPAEDLLMLGVVATLLEQIGARDVSVILTSEKGEKLVIVDAGEISAPPGILPLSSAVGRIEWRGFNRDACDGDNTAPLVVYGGNEGQPITGAVTRLIASDVARVWAWPEIAEILGESVRSLQRALSREETSLSELVRAVRVREACRLLETDDLSLTQIGFWCGFADSAHFSRDFKESLGMPPSAYRTTSAG